MTTGKITKSLRSSIAAEKQSVAKRSSQAAGKPADVIIVPAPQKPQAIKKVNPVATAKKPASINQAAATTSTAKPMAKIAPQTVTTTPSGKTQDKLVETNYHVYETYMENLQIANENLQEYLEQLIKIKNLSELIKLNLDYITSTPLRYQKMLAQNKSIFSDFFKFTLPKS